MLLRTILFTSVLAAFSACTTLRVDRILASSPGDWTTEGGSVSRANVSTGKIKPPLKEVWQYNAQAGIRAVPLVSDSTVIVATLNGEIQAVNLSNGKRIGYKAFESAVVGTPVLDGSSVILATAGKAETIVSYNLQRGRQNWAFHAGPVESSPLLYGGHVYVATVGGDVYCLQKETGEEVWKFEGEEKDRRKGFRSSPSTDGKLILFGSDSGTLYALNRTNGDIAWTLATGASIFASPVVSSHTVIVGNLKGILFAVDSERGTIRWTYDVGSPVYAAVAVDEALIYCSAANGTVYAIDSSGDLKWKFPTKAILNSAPLVSGDFLFVGSMDRVLYTLDRSSGKEVWRFQSEGRIRVSPVAWGDFLLVTSEDKFVTMLGPS
ncbi:MAG: PQQ-binding-like beta-propeller repeat protein [Ignavibacteriales bacterium]|nr:PQQ-binding-like beta-propeller repeat protein [Ignavibacteriales bacterium]